ncbi:MAG: class I SAM-dependent methyltransferase [Bacteroidota bacterium]
MNVDGYGLEEAKLYDDMSDYNKGHRKIHKQFLVDTLEYLDFKPKRFLDLGCGTGYFSEVIYDVFPNSDGTLVDASIEMLQIAQRKFLGKRNKKKYIEAFFQDLDWTELGKFDLVFSALAIHHLEDEQKWKLFADIHKYLNDGGVFILFDLFKSENEQSNELLEYLACKDCQRRLVEGEGVYLEEFEVNKIIQEDRRIRQIEGDKEACYKDQIDNLKKLEFGSITTIFQEARFAGTVAFK